MARWFEGKSVIVTGAAQADEIMAPDALAMEPYRGTASAQQIAEIALFLASPRASAMTGGTYVADGGWTATIGSSADGTD